MSRGPETSIYTLASASLVSGCILLFIREVRMERGSQDARISPPRVAFSRPCATELERERKYAVLPRIRRASIVKM